MKRLCVLLIALMFVLSSCSFEQIKSQVVGAISQIGPLVPRGWMEKYIGSSKTAALATFEKVYTAIQTQDAAAMEALFSEKAHKESSDLKEQVLHLFKFIQGEILHCDTQSAGQNTGFTKSDGKRQTHARSTYEIETSADTYELFVLEYPQDEFDPENIGVYSMYCIKIADIEQENPANIAWAAGEPGIYVFDE